MDRGKSNNEDLPTLQSGYIQKVLKRFNMENVKSAPTLLLTTTRLLHKDSPSTEDERNLTSRIPYALVVRSLMYTIVVSQPDLAHIVGVVGRLRQPTGQKAERSGQTRWEKAEVSVGPECITEGKEWGRMVDVTLG